MNSAQLLNHFDRISEAPDAIPRLRRFILALAVRGKLVEQDSREEPASELLKRIQAEKAQSIYEGRARKSRDVLAESDIPFNAPVDWEWVPLGEIVRIRTGKLDANAAVKGGTYPFFTCSQTPSEIDSYSFDTSAVLLAGNGDFNLKCYQGKFDAYQRTYVIEPLGWDLEFCFILMKSQISRITENQRGSAIPYLKLGDIADPVVPLPPLVEQHRIVAKVDELMALCDRLEAAQTERENRRDRLAAASLHRLNNGADPNAFRDHARFYFNHLPRLTTRPEHIQQLRQAILNLAVRGKLVPQDSNDEPAAILYDRLRSLIAKNQVIERTARRKDVLPTSIGFFGGDTFPTSWVLTNFDSVNAIFSGVAKGKDLRGVKTAFYPYLRVANVQRGYLDLNIIKKLEIPTDELGRYRLKRGDVLMTEGGDWDKLGRAAIWHEEVPNCIHQNHIYRIRSANREELLPSWIVLFANSPLGRSYFEGASKQTTNLASINMTQLRSCPLPLPPSAEQQRIVAKVDDLMSLCDRLEAQISTTQTESRHLLEAVLHEALAPAE